MKYSPFVCVSNELASSEFNLEKGGLIRGRGDFAFWGRREREQCFGGRSNKLEYPSTCIFLYASTGLWMKSLAASRIKGKKACSVTLFLLEVVWLRKTR